MTWTEYQAFEKSSGTVPGFFVVRRVRAAVPWSLDSSVAQTTKPRC